MQPQLEVIKSILGVSQGHVYIVPLTSSSSATPLIARVRTNLNFYFLKKFLQITKEMLRL